MSDGGRGLIAFSLLFSHWTFLPTPKKVPADPSHPCIVLQAWALFFFFLSGLLTCVLITAITCSRTALRSLASPCLSLFPIPPPGFNLAAHPVTFVPTFSSPQSLLLLPSLHLCPPSIVSHRILIVPHRLIDCPALAAHLHKRANPRTTHKPPPVKPTSRRRKETPKWVCLV